MDDLLEEFVAETREMAGAIEGELIAWEADPADSARLDAIFRFVHTVKGNCGFFDYPQLERLSHAAETTLSDVRAKQRMADSGLVTAILAIIDRIVDLTNAIDAGTYTDGDPATSNRLIAALEVDAVAPPPAEGEAGTHDNASDPAAAETIPNASPTLRSVRLPVELLDQVMSGMSDMVLARNDLARRLRESGNEPTLDGPFERLSAMLSDMRANITRMRMQRVDHLYSALPRLVRDIAAGLNKQVTMQCEGGDVELDREMIEMIRDPIMHLIRNCVDHGIEAPADREAAGKSETGTLRIASHQSGNRISMIVADDGRGLDLKRIGAQAVNAGLVTQDECDQLSAAAIADLIFEPGLSTADAVSTVSGRGVGMDAVKANIEKIGGTIAVSSTPGKGTRFELQLPLTLSIISALTVSIDGQFFAIPHSYVEEITHGRSASVEFAQVGDSDLLTFRGNRLPCLTLNSVLDVNPRRAGPDQRLVVLRLGSGALFALAVDRIHDQEDLVIKPLPPVIMRSRVYSGTTLLDDGRPVPMLDIPAIAAQNGLTSERLASVNTQDATMPAANTATGRVLMTFTDYAGRLRALDLDLVARIDQVSPEVFHIDEGHRNVVIDNRIFDVVGDYAADTDEEIVKVLRLSEGADEIAYPVARLGESINYEGTLTALEVGSGLLGIALVDGQPITVIDGYGLFAGRKSVDQDRPVCHLPENNEWSDRILKPLIEAAGYRPADIADGETAEPGAIRIMMAGSDPVTDPIDADGAIILLHDDPAHTDKQSGAIYLHDRPSIIAALRDAASNTERANAS